jgi:hypothetical protein
MAPMPKRMSLVALFAAGWFIAGSAGSQPLARKATTLGALATYPTFFHGQRVLVRAGVATQDGLTWLVGDSLRVLCLGACSRAAPADLLEISGTFWDAGRLEPGDARLRSAEVETAAERLLRKSWPAAGELLVVVAEGVDPVPPPGPVTLRGLALEPERYEGQRVTVSGRFRGRNLYGDLPQAPRRSRWDFVLQSADAAVWVTGIEPRGRDFRLDVDARVDTGRWLEVSGTVRYERGLVRIEATRVALATPPPEPTAPVVVSVPKGPAPEVIFSTPSPDEAEVPRESAVRVQFSRDMDVASFQGRIRVSYDDPSPSQGERARGTPIEFSFRYREGNRVLELHFRQPLEPFRTVRVDLLPGIAALDGVPMERGWTLRFTVGG